MHVEVIDHVVVAVGVVFFSFFGVVFYDQGDEDQGEAQEEYTPSKHVQRYKVSHFLSLCGF